MCAHASQKVSISNTAPGGYAVFIDLQLHIELVLHSIHSIQHRHYKAATKVWKCLPFKNGLKIAQCRWILNVTPLYITPCTSGLVPSIMDMKTATENKHESKVQYVHMYQTKIRIALYNTNRSCSCWYSFVSRNLVLLRVHLIIVHSQA